MKFIFTDDFIINPFCSFYFRYLLLFSLSLDKQSQKVKWEFQEMFRPDYGSEFENKRFELILKMSQLFSVQNECVQQPAQEKWHKLYSVAWNFIPWIYVCSSENEKYVCCLNSQMHYINHLAKKINPRKKEQKFEPWSNWASA